MKFAFYIVLPTALLLLAYQNCGDVSIVKPVEPPPLVKTSFEGSFCVSKNTSDTSFDLKNLFVVNITAKLVGGELYPDSDMDGIPDHLEEGYGLDPLNARTHGVLDGLCKEQGLHNCEINTALCDPDNFLATGLSECDLTHILDSPYKGINSDANDLQFNFDTIPDFIEILKGTDPLVADADLDNDGDLKTNEWEIKKGRDPSSTSDSDINDNDKKLMQYNYSLLGRDEVCENNWLYNISIKPPLVEVQAYDDGTLLSHEENENVILIYVVAENPQGKTEYWLAIKKINFYGEEEGALKLKPDDFFLDGSY